jgi:hypothetical protein
MKFLIRIIVLLIIGFSYLSAQSDTLVIKLKSGQVDKIAVTDIDNITFENIASVDDLTKQSGELAVKGNYPNPFSGHTEIEFEIATAGNVEILIYDKLGNVQSRVECQNCSAGRNMLFWDGTDKNGKQLPSGVYFYEVHFGKEVSSKQFILVK